MMGRNVAFVAFALFVLGFLIFAGVTAENLRNPVWYAVYAALVWIAIVVLQYRRARPEVLERPAVDRSRAAMIALANGAVAFAVVGLFHWLLDTTRSPVPPASFMGLLIAWMVYLSRTRTATTKRQLVGMLIIAMITIAAQIAWRRLITP